MLLLQYAITAIPLHNNPSARQILLTPTNVFCILFLEQIPQNFFRYHS